MKLADSDYRDLLERTPAVAYVADFTSEYRLRYISPQVESLLGFPAAAWLESADFWVQRLHPGDRERVIAEAEAAIADARGLNLRYRMLARDGRVVWIRENTRVVPGADGSADSVHGVMVEITSLEDAEAREAAILEAALDAIITLDSDGRVVEFNPAAERIFGYRRADAIGREMADLIVPERFRAAHRAGLQAAVEGRGGQLLGQRINLPAMRADGSEFPSELTITKLETVTSQVMFTGHLRDITERVETEARLAHLAYHDPLTGLANRTELERRLGLELHSARESGGAVALLYIDLDDFKLVNDSFGHVLGDQTLCEVGRRMQRVLRASDVVARHGGDEFLVLLGGLDDDAHVTADTVAHKLVAELRRPFALAGLEFQIGASVGFSLFPHDARDADDLLRHADAAMYSGKGTGRVSRFAADAADPRGRLTMTHRLERAIAEDELELHYQPIVRLADGETVGVEALVRWRDGERGLVAPGAFLPVAEQTGMIEPLGDWVVDALCRQASLWADHAPELRLAFNVSPLQLGSSRFARRLSERIAAHGLMPERFVAEITESATLRDPDRMQDALNELRAAGVRVAIDDFGAGYSSLSRLQEMPVDVLKIDRLLLRGRAAAAVVPAVVGLAATLGMECVAEGVETAADHALLLACHCPLAQGYLLGRPAPADVISERLTALASTV